MLRNCTSEGGLTHLPSFMLPWCWSAMGPLSGSPGIVTPGSTVWPLSTTPTVLPRTVISKRFHCPTGLSALTLGVAPARVSGGMAGSRRTPYISPEPTGQHQMFTWYLLRPRR